jgi:RNA polymerase sigma-70 factor (ECF subfamily)
MAKENTLIYRAQTGDEGAFADLMRAYHAFVYTIAIGIVDNPHDAEEVVQDAFLNAYQGLRQLEDATKFKGWLAEITRNRARNWLRKQQGETVSLDDVSEEMLQMEDSPDERLTQLEQRELIRRTMETLPQKDRDIARAFYLEGASYDELIRAHGLSYNAIALRLFRIKRKLSKQLRYLLTSIFVSPGLTLKKLYTRGLTAMKIGTASKTTVGAAALIALIFIGYIGIRHMNAPTVAERVYLSPWEDGTARPQSSPEGLAAQTNPTQDTESGDTQPQIASVVSTEERELIDDLFAELDETDLTQFATETEFDIDTEWDFTTDTSVSSESTNQSAEDVMYAYLEAWRKSDYKAMGSLMTEQYRREGHEDSDDGGSMNMSDEADEVVETRRRFDLVIKALLELRKQSSLVSSEYVGDEFHFRLITPGSDLPGTTDQGIPMFTPTSYNVMKMRKENGVWRVYDTVYDYESAMAEMPAANMRTDMGRSGHDGYETLIGIREVQHESSDGIPDEAVEAMADGKIKQLEPLPVESSREMRSQASAINGEYVGDEFDSGLRIPAPKIPGGREHGIEMSVSSLPDEEMRRMYKGEMLD